jgi:tetratricopeptide (TPR) repeat protein
MARTARIEARTRLLAALIGICAALAAFTSTYAQFDHAPTTGQLILLAVATVLSGGIAAATTFAGGAVVRSRVQHAQVEPVPIAYVTADEGWASWIRQELRNLGYQAHLNPGPLESVSGIPAVALLSRTAVARSGGAEAWFAAATSRFPPPVIACVDDVPVPEDSAGLVEVVLPELTADAAADALAQALLRRGLPAPRPSGEPSRAVPFPGRGPAITNLPPRNTDFTGRGDLLDRLHQELIAAPAETVSGQARAAVLHGLGGVGKTQTALEFAYRHAGHYEIVWWVAAERPSSIMSSLQRLARRLGLSSSADRDDLLWDLWSELRKRERWLVVFDSAADAEVLQPFWPPIGDGHVLVTSRSHSWHGLIGRTVAVGVPSHEEAARYLCRRSTDPDTDAALELARALDSLPLALAQAASYVYEKQTRLSVYLDLLSNTKHKADLLGTRPPPDYQHTVLHTWRLSIQEADRHAPGARDLLTVLCFLASEEIPRTLPPAGAAALPPALAERVADPVAYDEMIGALAGYSLINAHTDGLDIHQLVQFTVRTGLSEAEQAQWAEHAVRMTARAYPAEVRTVANWPDCVKLLPHALAVCETAATLGLAPDDVGDLLRRAAGYLDLQGDAGIAEPLLIRALALQEAAHGPDHIAVAHTLRALALVRFHLVRIAAAREAFERALAIEEAAPVRDDELIAQTLADFAEMLREIPDLAAAEAAAVRALRISRSIYGTDDTRTAPHYQRVGVARWRAGALEWARQQHGRALGIYEGTGDPPGAEVAESAKNLGIVCRDMCRFGQAEWHLARAVEIATEVYGPRHLTTLDSVMHLADVRRLLGEPEAALELLAVVEEETRRRLGARSADLAGVRTKIGAALRDTGRLEEARDTLAEAADAYTRARGPSHPYLAETLVQLGPVRRLLGDRSAAVADLRNAETIFITAYGPEHPALAEVYDYLIPLLRESSDHPEADRLTLQVTALRDRAARVDPHDYPSEVDLSDAAPQNLDDLDDLGRTT